MEKRCKTCGEMKPLDAFWISRGGKMGRYPRCRECESAASKESRRAVVEAAEIHRESGVPGLRRCTVCKEVKPADLEYFHEWGNGRLRSCCRPCYLALRRERAKSNLAHNREYQRKRRERLPDYCRQKNHERRLKRHGLTPDDYQKMLAAQSGVCGICGLPEQGRSLSIDHDHSSGIVRGLLCSRCNNLIGLAGEDIGVLVNAIFYLRVSSWMNRVAAAGHNPIKVWLGDESKGSA